MSPDSGPGTVQELDQWLSTINEDHDRRHDLHRDKLSLITDKSSVIIDSGQLIIGVGTADRGRTVCWPINDDAFGMSMCAAVITEMDHGIFGTVVTGQCQADLIWHLKVSL